MTEKWSEKVVFDVSALPSNLQQDEIGTPYCVTVDFDTLEDGCVTVRERDTMAQVRIPIA